jgi:DNA-binding PadR family transcriptional regulator
MLFARNGFLSDLMCNGLVYVNLYIWVYCLVSLVCVICLIKDILYTCTTEIQKEKKLNTMHKDVQVKLTKSLLDLIILQILENHPMHGYEILLTIQKSFGVYCGASTIYPFLNKMEKKKYVKHKWNMDTDRPKKVYELTVDGKAMLDYTAGSLRSICKSLGKDSILAHNEVDQALDFQVASNLKRERLL